MNSIAVLEQTNAPQTDHCTKVKLTDASERHLGWVLKGGGVGKGQKVRALLVKREAK